MSENDHELAVTQLVQLFNVGLDNRGTIERLSVDELMMKMKGDTLYGLGNCTITNRIKDAPIHFPVKIDNVKSLELDKCSIRDYTDWPAADEVYLSRCHIGKGIGEYVKERVSTFVTNGCLIPLQDFDLILGSGAAFDIVNQDLYRLAHDGHDYWVNTPKEQVKFEDPFELQDYLMSSDYLWQMFFWK